jgi:hypothetical protein
MSRLQTGQQVYENGQLAGSAEYNILTVNILQKWYCFPCEKLCW